MDAGEAKLMSDVERHGWSVMKVSNDAVPDFAYSVGLHRTFGHPELIAFGLDLDVMHRLINDVGEAVRGSARFRSGAISDAFLEGFGVTFRAVPQYQYAGHLGWARWFYDSDDFPALQLVYPDRHGRWPWQSGVSEEFRAIQPVLADMPEPPWAKRPAV